MLYGVIIVKGLDILLSFVIISDGVRFVHALMIVKNCVLVKYVVLIVVAVIQVSALSVHHTSLDMKCLQNNIQSINTSLLLLRYTLQKFQIDIALLQEIWHPVDGVFRIRNYAPPIMKLRQGSEGGGVAIITQHNVKSVHLREYDIVGLEAVWAEVMCNGLRAVVGSVYIAPGDIKALDALDSVVGAIMAKHSRPANASDFSGSLPFLRSILQLYDLE